MLHSKWLEASLRDLEPPGPAEGKILEFSVDLRAHVEECAQCLDEAEALKDLDEALRQSFLQLTETVSEPAQEERMDQTLAQLREDSELGLLRRLQRGMRLVLWTAFYGFTLLGACLLVIAAYRALKALLT